MKSPAVLNGLQMPGGNRTGFCCYNRIMDTMRECKTTLWIDLAGQVNIHQEVASEQGLNVQ